MMLMDFVDHVWTEVYSEFKGRWVHCDSGEEAYDQVIESWVDCFMSGSC